MRILFKVLLLVWIFHFSGEAQNFNHIIHSGTSFYGRPGEDLRGYRFDSVKMQGPDSVFYAPRTIIRNPNKYLCSDTNNGPVLSMIVLRNVNGWYRFITLNGDTAKINPDATLNETWTVMPLSGNILMKARVTDIRIDSVMDTLDQVKEITFQAEYLNGSTFPHIFNGLKIILSQHFGFSKTIDWNHFPNDTLKWSLKGTAIPKRGLQDFTKAECYDFQVGDEFHYHQTDYYWMAGRTVITNTIKTILSRVNYGADSVLYTFSICKKIWYPQPPPNTSTSWDTIADTFVLANDDDWFNQIPDQFEPDRNLHRASRYWKQESGLNGKPTKGFSPKDYCYGSTNLCWIENCFEDTYREYDYADGLGRITFRYYYGDPMSYYCNTDENLVYYKKGSETWGTPVATDCNILVGIQSGNTLGEITVFPNPGREELFADLPSNAGWFELYDPAGILVTKSSADRNKKTRIGTAQLKPGLYIYLVRDANQAVIARGKWIKE